MRKLTGLLTLLALALPAASAGAQAVVPAPPGSEAQGVEFLGNIPINGSVGANFKTYGDKTYMFVTGALGAAKFDPGLAGGLNYGGLWVYDVSTDPESPALVSHLPMPHYESEDVSIGGNRLLISGDGTQGGSNLVVIDISDPTLPTVEKVINMNVLGEGHTATCIQDCHYVWVAGSSTIKVIDLEGTPDVDVAPGVFPALSAQSKSVEVGSMKKEPQFGWAVHDVQVDDAGIAWVVGGDGTVGFDARPGAYGPANLLKPTVVASTGDDAVNSGGSSGLGPDGSTVNDFIHHNTFRPNANLFAPRTDENLMDAGLKPGEKVLITEEDIWSRTTFGTTRGGCKTQGSFQVWQVKQFDGPTTDGATKFLGDWKTEYNGLLGQGRLPTDDVVASEGFCSAHYFDTQKGSGNLTAIAWYAQGTRLLDTSDPAHIKQVGYFMAPDSTVWATYFSP
ncbi:MAG: hypothetical protein JWM73_852, partial [Solirubrobacterales bacterium]|nr:hypothetical protein [Solirubrobacterales bacterium]